MTSSTILFPAATEKQLSYIKSLASERPWSDVLDGNLYERCFDLMTGSGKYIGKAEASSIISALLAVKPSKPATTNSTTVTTTGLDLSAIPSGIYAVPGGDTRLKVKIDQGAGKWAGWTFVKDGAEYGYGKRYGSQKPGAKYQGAILAELTTIAADPAAAAKAYAAITGRCGICNRQLEDEDSVARGIGPVCAAKVGW